MNRSSIALAATVLALTTATADAQSSGNRANTWDVALQAVGNGSIDVDGEMGSSLSVDSEIGWGFGATYNFTNRLALGFDANTIRPRYEATFIEESTMTPFTINAEARFWNFQARGTFNLIDGPLTPFIEGGIGWSHVDSNVADGPPITGCWWDPWWGYICQTFFSTYSDTRFSYSGAIGGRWDINRDYGVKATYGKLWIDASSGETRDLDLWRAEFYWRFW